MADPQGEFVAFVDAQGTPLLRFAVLLAGDRQAAEDLLQSTLEGLYRRWRRSGAPDDPASYARTALVNAARRSWSLRRRSREQLVDELPEVGVESEGSDVVLRRRLFEALGSLPPQQRAVLALRFFEDRSEAETAALLGVRVGTVKSQTSRALQRLRNSPDVLVHLDPAMET